MYFDDETPDEMSLFDDEREQAREESQVQRQFDRMLNEPDYLSEAAVLARAAFAVPVPDEIETDADVALRISLGLRNEFGLPNTKAEADYMAEQARLQGEAYKKWVREETERERQEYGGLHKKERAA